METAWFPAWDSFILLHLRKYTLFPLTLFNYGGNIKNPGKSKLCLSAAFIFFEIYMDFDKMKKRTVYRKG